MHALLHGSHLTSGDIAIGIIIIVLAGILLLTSFIWHLKWRERIFMWEARIFFHLLIFVAILAAIGYVWIGAHGGINHYHS